MTNGYKPPVGEKTFLMEPLGNYVLLLHISAGGMAELFLAVRLGPEGFERLAAIKRIHRHLTLQRDFIDMFVQEAKVAALLSHPNIVHIYDLGAEGDTYYIAMEYVSGKDLGDVTRRWQEQGKVWPPEQAAFVISKVCAGLDYAHKKKDLKGNDLNLVHRDISPQNILLSYDGEVKLVDFGIAKAATQSTVTQTGVLKGKVAYMSPEQSWGSSLDRRSDIFSTGIVLYEMLTGRRLFKGESDLNTLEQVRRCVVEPPTRVGVDIPADLEAIVLKALAREPAQRYQTAGHLQADLEKFLYDHRYSPTSYNLSMSMHSLFQGEIVEEGLKIKKAEQQIQLWRESRDSDLAATKVSTIVSSPPPSQPEAPAPPLAPPVSAPPRPRPAVPPPAAKPPARTGLKALFLVLGLLVFLGVAAAGGYLAYQWYGGKRAEQKGADLPTPASPPETETLPAPASPPASPGESTEAPPSPPRRIAKGEKEPASPPSLPPKEETPPPALGAPPQSPPQYAFSFAGAGQSLLEDPVAMAADVSGNLFVLDHQRHKIIKFNARGEMLTSWGQKGSRQGEFINPRGITVDHFGNVYVADTGNARVQKFNGFGVFSALVGGKDKTTFQEPVAVAADRNGHLFILDRKKAKVFKFSLRGDFLSEWGGEGEGMLKTPVKMAVGPRFMLIMDAGTNRIHRFNAQGEFIQALGPRKEGQLGRKRPIDIAIDRMGRIYLLEAEGGRVFRFNPQGKLETFFGGKEEGVIQNPSAITVTPRGAVLVADRGSGKIHEFK